VPEHVEHNAHMYYVLVRDLDERTRVIDELSQRGVHAVFHYVPLHSAPAGLQYGRAHGDLWVTDRIAAQLIRLPLWYRMPKDAVDRVTAALAEAVVEL
jgi:dTDP-4-amino-4,6-dideoxygalactose transaminase